jgi:hypothetical protein
VLKALPEKAYQYFKQKVRSATDKPKDEQEARSAFFLALRNFGMSNKLNVGTDKNNTQVVAQSAAMENLLCAFCGKGSHPIEACCHPARRAFFSPSYQGPCFVDMLLGGGLGVQNFPSGAPEPAPARAELEARFDRTKGKEQRGRPGCVAYRLGRERLLLQAASWSMGCSNFDRFLHTASKLGSKLCSTISNHPTP